MADLKAMRRLMDIGDPAALHAIADVLDALAARVAQLENPPPACTCPKVMTLENRPCPMHGAPSPWLASPEAAETREPPGVAEICRFQEDAANVHRWCVSVSAIEALATELASSSIHTIRLYPTLGAQGHERPVLPVTDVVERLRALVRAHQGGAPRQEPKPEGMVP